MLGADVTAQMSTDLIRVLHYFNDSVFFVMLKPFPFTQRNGPLYPPVALDTLVLRARM